MFEHSCRDGGRGTPGCDTVTSILPCGPNARFYWDFDPACAVIAGKYLSIVLLPAVLPWP